MFSPKSRRRRWLTRTSVCAAGWLVWLTLAGPFMSDASAQSGNESVLLLPYQPVLQSVPQVTVDQVTGHLARELNQSDRLTVVPLIAQDGTAPEAPSLGSAEEHRQRADEAERAKNIREAVREREQVVTSIERNAAALTEIDPYVDALHRWARALMWSAADEQAQAAMARAARIMPSYPLPPAEYARLYRRWFAEKSSRVLRQPRGQLRVTSALAGATISLDGREMGVAPVMIDRVVPGRHLITAEVEGRPRYGAFVDVEGRRTQDFVATFADPSVGANARAVMQAVADNGLPPAALRAAVAAARTKGARFVVAGGVAADPSDGDLNVHTVVIDAQRRRAKALEPLDFDAELLTAESDVVQIVRAVEANVPRLSDGLSKIDWLERNPPSAARAEITRADGAPAEPNDRRRALRKDGARRVFQASESEDLEIDDP